MNTERTNAPDRRLADLFAQALRHHQAGQLAEAERLYRQILSSDSRHADSLHLLGLIAQRMGRSDAAVQLIETAIGILPTVAPYHSNLGVALLALNQTEPAVAAFRTAICLAPDFTDPYANLGLVQSALGRAEPSVAAFEAALRLRPGVGELQIHRGVALSRIGKSAQAIAAFGCAICLKPDDAESYANLGYAGVHAGRFGEALTHCARAVRIRPDWPEAHYGLANSLIGLRYAAEALEAYDAAIKLKPDYAEAHTNRGSLLRDLGRLDEAVAAYEAATRLNPTLAEAYCNLGNALRDLGRFDRAIESFDAALRARPNFAEAYANLGNVFLDLGKSGPAANAYLAALCLKPEQPETHSNLGCVLRDLGVFAASSDACIRAIRLRHDQADAHLNLGNVLKDLGRIDDAVLAYREAVRIKPDYPSAQSNLLLALYYLDELTGVEIYAQAQEFSRRFENFAVPGEFPNSADPARRLRIGYVSPDFRSHSISWFIEPILRAHDREAFEIMCYSDVKNPDQATDRSRDSSDRWAHCVGLSDAALAERIRGDQIDILVDLAGHTGNNRLMAFARKPAPVQVNWLGDPGTTGLRAIDYRLVDARTDPVDDLAVKASESLFRLPDAFMCYGPPAGAEQASPRDPAGPLTFGSFNNPSKLSLKTLDLWSAILARMPESRLMLKGPAFGCEAGRSLFRKRFAERGVSSERIEFAGSVAATSDHLALYRRVDIALDPLPYNGATTTCEALWMGVPVITLRGDRFSARMGSSLLTQVGLCDLIGGSSEDYVEIAVRLARDPNRRAELRASLRPRLIASPLCDVKRFTRNLENAYRTMWHAWCRSTG